MKKPAHFILVTILSCLVLTTRAQEPKTGFDIHILYKIQKTRTPFQTAFFKTISDLNNPVCLAVPAILFLIGWRKKIREYRFDALEVTQTIALSQLLSFSLKIAFGRLRPEYFDHSFVPLVHALNKSFPSGHTTESFAMATIIMLIGLRRYFIVAAFCWAVLIGYARMYLGVHFPTDVLGGIVLGSGSAWLVWMINKRTNIRGNEIKRGSVI